MHYSHRTLLITGLVIVAAALIGGGWYFTREFQNPYAVSSADSIASWNFTGVYTGNTELENKARMEIKRLSALRGGEEFTDYQLYVSISNQYGLMGDGEHEYEYLGRALAIDDSTTGLAWHNMGVLFEKLDALDTARGAYGHAVKAQSNVIMYHTAYLNFLIEHFATDEALLNAAFAESEKILGELPDILRIKAQWLTDTRQSAAAIGVWQKIQAHVSSEEKRSIDEEIWRLKASK
jgi:tetratricopeptide (TPR) repeat protein